MLDQHCLHIFQMFLVAELSCLSQLSYVLGDSLGSMSPSTGAHADIACLFAYNAATMNHHGLKQESLSYEATLQQAQLVHSLRPQTCSFFAMCE